MPRLPSDILPDILLASPDVGVDPIPAPLRTADDPSCMGFCGVVIGLLASPDLAPVIESDEPEADAWVDDSNERWLVGGIEGKPNPS